MTRGKSQGKQLRRFRTSSGAVVFYYKKKGIKRISRKKRSSKGVKRIFRRKLRRSSRIRSRKK